MSRRRSPFGGGRSRRGRLPKTPLGWLLLIVLALLWGLDQQRQKAPPAKPRWPSENTSQHPPQADAPPQPPATPGQTFAARVARVVDGDTVTLTDGVKVRYIGLDTPEKPRQGSPGECLWREATQANEALVLGKTVLLEPGAETHDRYGRLLAYVYVKDATGQTLLVNEALLQKGLAVPLGIRPNTRLKPRFEAVYAQARRQGVGLWREGACEN